MNSLNAYIVDDEKNSRLVLKEILSKFFPQVNILGEASNIEDAFEEISSLKPNLVFLDIQMPHGNGFGLLQKFDKIPFQVVFITSHNQFALQAFRFNALDYLLKPIDVEELEQAIEKAQRATINLEDYQMRIDNALNTLDPLFENKKIPLHRNGTVHLISISSIVSIQGDGRYSLINTVDGEKFTSTKTLKEYEDFLESFGSFIRIHKETIVNINYISQYSKQEPFWIKMNNGNEFEISRRKKQEVLELLKKV